MIPIRLRPSPLKSKKHPVPSPADIVCDNGIVHVDQPVMLRAKWLAMAEIPGQEPHRRKRIGFGCLRRWLPQRKGTRPSDFILWLCSRSLRPTALTFWGRRAETRPACRIRWQRGPIPRGLRMRTTLFPDRQSKILAVADFSGARCADAER